MSVDVSSEITIERLPGVVSAYACDPDNATRWHANVKSAEWKSEPIVHVGSRIAFVADFLGRRLEYTYEIVEFVPGERLVMRTVDGPYPMETTYLFATASDNSTRMTVRSRAELSGVSKVMAPMIAVAMKSATEKGLARLKEILED
jgi:uncharacterized membrane protein